MLLHNSDDFVVSVWLDCLDVKYGEKTIHNVIEMTLTIM